MWDLGKQITFMFEIFETLAAMIYSLDSSLTFVFRTDLEVT